jgi:tRNA 2-thiouridine synthesizing protein A
MTLEVIAGCNRNANLKPQEAGMKLDVRGEICPYPMMKTEQALKALPLGETLEVITDHPPALVTCPRAAECLGFRTHVQEIGASEWVLSFWR